MNSATIKCRSVFLVAATLVLAGVVVRPAAAQVITEFRTPTSRSRPLDIASGPGGMWFTEPGANRIGLISPQGRISEFGVARSPGAIVAGPDANLWFTSPGFLSRMTPTGAVTDFPVSGDPRSIAVGPDGNIWFIGYIGERIGRATVAGQITDFSVPGIALRITPGSDGNLWFTEAGAGNDRIGRITTNGVLTEFRVLTSESGDQGIVAGSDGNLWFTENRKIGRITPEGKLAEFGIPDEAYGIAADSDGNLWFTYWVRNKIGRMTTRGDYAEFDIPTPAAQARSISLGLDGNIWFTESGTGQIGKISLVASRIVDLSVGDDDKTRLLRIDGGSGQMALDTVSDAGSITPGSLYGPYQGWAARSTAAGSDGLTRVLWTHDDGSAALWLVGPESNQASYRLGPVTGWTAVDVAASVAGTTHLLWKDTDGRIALWSVDNAGHVSTGPAYGPYPGWTSVAIADGLDGVTQVLANGVDGSAGLSSFGPEGLLASYRFGPVAGWRAVDVALGADGQTRILWNHLDGRMALWRVDDSGTPTALGPIYPPPPGVTASRVAAGPDGLTRVLWTGVNGTAVLWIMSADNVFREFINLGPSPDSGIAGSWTGRFDSADFVDCDSNSPAQASFQQNGSTVSGTLNATENGCGFTNVTFQGTLEGKTLAGTIAGDRFRSGSAATGTLSGATLEITVMNSFGLIPGGQMHLHR